MTNKLTFEYYLLWDHLISQPRIQDFTFRWMVVRGLGAAYMWNEFGNWRLINYYFIRRKSRYWNKNARKEIRNRNTETAPTLESQTRRTQKFIPPHRPQYVEMAQFMSCLWKHKNQSDQNRRCTMQLGIDEFLKISLKSILWFRRS